MTAASADPIVSGELDGLFCEHLSRPLALAVSGGPDSMALMQLVSHWRRHAAQSAHDDDVLVLTVDHGLRSSSAGEAALVARTAASLGLRHQTLVWSGDKPATGLQAAARRARYDMMTAAILSEGVNRALVTAHHADDQAETLLMRLARGSGLEGLAAMRTLSTWKGVDVVRPLLGVSRARLVATLRAAGATWIDDPTNADARFERTRVRQLRTELAGLGLDTSGLARSARRLQRADAALQRMTSDLALSASVDRHDGAYISFDHATFCAGAAEARVRLLARLVNAMGGAAKPPQLSELERLDDALSEGPVAGLTLGGAIVRTGARGHVQLFRETARHGPPPLTLRRNETQIWDQRFRVTFMQAGRDSLLPVARVEVRALGAHAYATLRAQGAAVMPALAAAALPTFFSDDVLIAVPGLAVGGSGSSAALPGVLAAPSGRLPSQGVDQAAVETRFEAQPIE